MSTKHYLTSKHRTARDVAKNFTTSFDSEYHIYLRLLSSMCRDVKSPLAAGVLSIIKYSEDTVSDLLEVSCSPSHYSDAVPYYKDAQIVAWIKKKPFKGKEEQSLRSGVHAFINAELQCKVTNERFFNPSIESRTSHSDVLLFASKIIASVLGDTPCLADIPFSFGPGANVNVTKNTTAYDKLDSTLDINVEASSVAQEFLQTCPGWYSMHYSNSDRVSVDTFNIVPGDRLGFVPKTAKIDRPIATGPSFSVLMQKGLGSIIRKKFSDAFYDLKTAQATHRRAAQRASIDGLFATVDLSSASDTISFGVVQSLLPPDWFDLLYSVRSSSYSLPKRLDPKQTTYDYHKFSAMGNGYTFELETLLFYSIVRAVCIVEECSPHQLRLISVYGDDILCPVSVIPRLYSVLEHCGFTVNKDKSFHTGPFRESCGGDYFNGINVRPFYLKADISFRTLFLSHNWFERTGYKFYFPSLFREIRKLIGPSILEAFSGSGVDGDFHIENNLASYLPVWTLRPIVKYRKVKATWNRTNKSFYLYRQLQTEMDSSALLAIRSLRLTKYGGFSSRVTKFDTGTAPFEGLPIGKASECGYMESSTAHLVSFTGLRRGNLVN